MTETTTETTTDGPDTVFEGPALPVRPDPIPRVPHLDTDGNLVVPPIEKPDPKVPDAKQRRVLEELAKSDPELSSRFGAIAELAELDATTPDAEVPEPLDVLSEQEERQAIIALGRELDKLMDDGQEALVAVESDDHLSESGRRTRTAELQERRFNKAVDLWRRRLEVGRRFLARNTPEPVTMTADAAQTLQAFTAILPNALPPDVLALARSYVAAKHPVTPWLVPLFRRLAVKPSQPWRGWTEHAKAILEELPVPPHERHQVADLAREIEMSGRRKFRGELAAYVRNAGLPTGSVRGSRVRGGIKEQNGRNRYRENRW